MKNSFNQLQKSYCALSYHSQLPSLATRNDFIEILRGERLERAANIGVQQGRYAKYLLNNWPECKEYHAIDLWKHQVHYIDHVNVIDEQQDQNYNATCLRLKKMGQNRAISLKLQ